MTRALILVVVIGAISGLLIGCPPPGPQDSNNNQSEFPMPNMGTGTLPTPAERKPAPDPVDTDGDGMSDQQEDELGTNTQSADTDGDSIPDKDEVGLGLNPLVGDTVAMITAVECQSCIVLDGVAWFTWSIWTNWFVGWEVGNTVVVVIEPGSPRDATLRNLALADVIPTLSRKLGTRHSAGSIGQIDDPVDDKGGRGWLKIGEQKWDIARPIGTEAAYWAVGDHVVVIRDQSDGANLWYLLNTRRCEYVNATPN